MNLRRKTVVTVISKIGDRRPKADACLVVIYGQAMGQKYVLKPGEIVIGRSSQSQIQIDHESVSRRHARLIHTEAGISLSDLGSTNGTYVNDEPIQEVALSNGDLVKVGRSILKYLSTDNIEGAYHEEIYRLTTVDGLTRCYNARFLREAMARETSRANRYGRPLSVVVFDIDDFQQINDDFGHLAGDAVLAQLGKRIGRRIRREDIFARTGGGEFALLVPEVGKQGAVHLGHRLLRMIGETAFGFDDVQIPVTLSIGIADMAELQDDKEAGAEHVTPISEGADAFASSTSAELGYESRTGDGTVDRFQALSDRFLDLARQRVMQAKSGGKGRLAS